MQQYQAMSSNHCLSICLRFLSLSLAVAFIVLFFSLSGQCVILLLLIRLPRPLSEFDVRLTLRCLVRLPVTVMLAALTSTPTAAVCLALSAVVQWVVKVVRCVWLMHFTHLSLKYRLTVCENILSWNHYFNKGCVCNFIKTWWILFLHIFRDNCRRVKDWTNAGRWQNDRWTFIRVKNGHVC